MFARTSSSFSAATRSGRQSHSLFVHGLLSRTASPIWTKRRVSLMARKLKTIAGRWKRDFAGGVAPWQARFFLATSHHMHRLLEWLTSSQQYFHDLGWMGIFAFAAAILIAQIFLVPLSPFGLA